MFKRQNTQLLFAEACEVLAVKISTSQRHLLGAFLRWFCALKKVKSATHVLFKTVLIINTNQTLGFLYKCKTVHQLTTSNAVTY
jgi:hypothetical protein